jgi:hypothetical protein
MPIIASRASAAYGAGFGKLLSAAGGETNYSAFDAIYSTTLSTTASSITIQGIPQNYTHLQIRIVARNSGTDYRSGLGLRLNLDSASGSGYSLDRLWITSGVNAGASNADTNHYAGLGMANDSNGLANAYGISITDILDYSSVTKAKGFRTLSHYSNNTTGVNDGDRGGIVFTTGLKDYSTGQVTGLYIFSNGNNLLANTTVSLYGIR